MDRHEWFDQNLPGDFRAEADGLHHYVITPEVQGWPLVDTPVSKVAAREILRLAARERELQIFLNLGGVKPETREAMLALASAIGVDVTPITTAAQVASAATARVKELEGTEAWALSEALKIRDAKIEQLRSQRDEEKRRADELEQDACDYRRTADALNSRAVVLERQVAEYEEARRVMARKNLDLARERAALANRVKELERENQEVRDRAVRAERGAPVIVGDAGLRRRILALEGKLTAVEGLEAVEAAVKPYRDEVAYLNRQITIGDERLASSRARVAELDELAIQRRLRIEELESILVEVRATGNRRADRIEALEQENHRLRDGIGRALSMFAASTHWCSNLAEAGPILRAAVHGDASERLRRDRAEAVSLANESVTREKLEEMSKRVREIKGGLAPDPEPRFSKEAVRNAVNGSCTCGGCAPYDEAKCPACDVWHRLVLRPDPLENV